MKYFYLIFLTILFTIVVNAHSWFPIECCSGNDCKEITEFSEIGDKWLISTKEATVLIDKSFPIRSSLDAKKYVCIHNKKVYCLFFPASY